jgi:hypothetical protein
MEPQEIPADVHNRLMDALQKRIAVRGQQPRAE